MQKREQAHQPLNSEQIISAYQIILNPNCNKETIKKADMFLNQCEQNPSFALNLMQIIAHTNKKTTQRQALLHLSNVIKRCWTNKRRVHNLIYLSEQTKQSIKNGLVQLYKMYWSTYYKDFNQIFKFLAKFEFPSNYLALKNFMTQILRTMANSDMQAVITPAQLLPYLSLVKTVFKQNANRRFLHTKQIYLEHIAQNVRLSVQILQKIDNAINSIKNTNQQNLDIGISNKLLECSRKVDKIILYCLQCAVSTMQTDSQISQIIEYMVKKIQLLLQIRFRSLRQQVQLNIFAIIQGVSKLQIQLPFSFTNFLLEYLGVIINLLINETFSNQNLTNCVITSNTKPLVTFQYYSNFNSFKQSIQSKKGIGSSYSNEQAKCHQVFTEIYGGQNSTVFMEKAITQLMDKYRNHHNLDLCMFQENEHQQVASEYSSFELLLLLLKNLMARFKQQFKLFVSKIIDHLLLNKLTASSSQINLNMYEIVLLSAKVYDESNLQLAKVFELMKLNFDGQDFLMFSRLIRSYNSYFDMSTIYKSFQILINIIATPNTDHQIIYQCGVCIKKMLSEHEEGDLPLQNIGLCLGNLFSLVYVYKNNPSHLWTLLQLISQIIKLVNNEVMINNLGYILESVNYLIDLKDNGQLTINGAADLLQNILELIQSDQNGNEHVFQSLYQTSIKLISKYIYSREIESVDALYRLWLSVAKNVSVSKNSRELVQKLANALHALRNKLLKDDPIIFLEITQQYILGGLISPTVQDIQQLGSQILALVRQQMSLQDSGGAFRLLMAFFSLYFSYFLATGTFIPNLVVILMKFIQQFHNKMSQQINLLRSFLVVVLNHHIIVLGPQKIFQILNTAHNNNYQEWYWPYIWCLEYLSNKYSCKVASIALLSSLDILQQANILLPQIQEHIPLLRIMKAASFNVESINTVTAMNCYMSSFTNMMQSNQKKSRLKFGISGLKSTPRKYKIHVNSQWAECDISQMYREKFSPILRDLGWTIQTINAKFDKQGSTKIIFLLTGTKNDDQN